MPLPEPAQSGPESYSARLKRKLRAQELAQPKSKSELAALERAKREAGLSRSLLELDDSGEGESKGLKMMKMMGFTPGVGLGSGRTPGRLEPLGVKIRAHRGGIGLDGEGDGEEHQKKGKERVAAPAPAVVDPEEYRERVRMEREKARLEAQLRAAQKVCEKFDDGGGEAGVRSVPLKSVNVLWRGLVKEREERDREARRKHELQNIDSPRLAGYHRDRELDLEDKIALGIAPENFRKLGTMVVEETDDDVSDDDEELREFQELEVAERLERVVGYLRSGYKYCFWCKYKYPDEDMDGCPGVGEDLHG